jgi:hypothetical protein
MLNVPEDQALQNVRYWEIQAERALRRRECEPGRGLAEEKIEAA